MIAFGGVAVPATATAATPAFAPVGAATIMPGALMVTPLDARTAAECTADFVFATAEHTYLGFSAHCASRGESAELSGCEAAPLPLGTAVYVQGSDRVTSRGRLAYSSWATMQARGETDDGLCLYNDFALVELDASTVAKLNPSVPVLGGPTGLDDDGLLRGEDVYSYQPNNGPPEVKDGRSLGDSADGLTHRVVTTPPGVPGDSGSPFLDADGRAFGVLSTQFNDARSSNGVTDLAAALAYADSYGGLGDVELVAGTEPFGEELAASAQ